jgi:RNA polymerase subunit RPABC4/transcription elongation factor Spt4
MGRTLVMIFLFINLILCFYVAYELFRTADYLAGAFKILALGGVQPPDFIELKALGIYVFLLGISGFVMAYWVYEDGKNIERLVRSRKLFMRGKAQAKAPIMEHGEIQLLECPECGEELEEGFEVCPKCGYELKPIICPKCGKEISRTFNFCPYCGNEMQKE